MDVSAELKQGVLPLFMLSRLQIDGSTDVDVAWTGRNSQFAA